MPLVRYVVKNEYMSLGVPELYNNNAALAEEDPKGVLDGVAVSGLVGFLRHLGDLSQFAVEVFHGLQEQVAFTASRSRKLVTRVQRVEAFLPQFEKDLLSQTTHMRYAYTPGSEWHARIRNEQNHFIYDDLPHFVMDSYEECREPPRLQTLDRFDTGGPGSCLKRYSDPTFFKRASSSSKVPNGEKPQHKRTTSKIKRRRSWQQSGCFPEFAPTVDGSGRLQLSSSTFHGQSSLPHTGSTFDPTFKSNLGDKSDSLGDKDGTDECIECVFHPRSSIQPDNAETTGLCSKLNEELEYDNESIYLDKCTAITGTSSPSMEATHRESSSVSWDEKADTNSLHNEHGSKPANPVYVYPIEDLSEHGSPLKSIVDHYSDEIHAIRDLPKVCFKLDNQDLKPVNAENVDQADLFEHESPSEFPIHGYYPKTTIDESFKRSSQLIGTDWNFELLDNDGDSANVEGSTQAMSIFRGKYTSDYISGGNPIDDSFDRKLGTNEVQHVLLTKVDIVEEVNVCQVGAFSEDGHAVAVVESNQHNDIESETELYVDALNTIESEIESDFERHTNNKKVLISNPNDGVLEDVVNEQIVEITNHREFEHECHSLSYKNGEQSPDDYRHSTALVSSGPEGKKLLGKACLSNKQSVQCNQSSYALGIDYCVNEPAFSEAAASGSQDSSTEEMICTPHPSQEMPVGLSSTYPPDFWTNEILLGLEPSKPTVHSMSNAMQKLDISAGVLTSSRRDTECDNSFEGPRLDTNNQDDVLFKHMSHSILDQGNLFVHSMISGLSAGSSGYADKPTVTNPLHSDSESNLYASVFHSALETNLKRQLHSPRNSPPPSPPVEHLKISFRHIDGSETSKLKLKYPKGVDNQEISLDTFPSFQLVPESTNLKHDIGSDSDDDTFSRSYACMSDDYLSHLSDSNSEEWESEDDSESNYHATNVGLNGISSTESTSSSPLCEETAQRSINAGFRYVNAVHSESSPSSGLSAMSTKNSFSTKLDLNPELDSSNFQQATPHTPPLPPLQWRVSRPLCDAESHKQDQGSNNFNQSYDDELSGLSIPHLSVVDSARLLNTRDKSVAVSKTNKLNEQKLDPQTRNHQVAKGRREDEMGSFLHQIRTKSLNLRRTEPARSTHTTSTATSYKVSAIVQKANAIRRAVGTDGEDDSWSDT